MNCLVVDDEVMGRKLIEENVKQIPFLNLVGSCSNAFEAMEVLQKEKVDLIFLDIQMPGKTGFDLLAELDRSPQVIFTTAHHEYALKAFEVNALDYLMKPIDPVRLADAIQKVQQLEAARIGNGEGEVLPNGVLSENDQVFVKDGDRCWFVKLNEIRFFESVGNYARVFFGNNKPMILKSLNALEDRLDSKLFFRTNRKHIVNLRMIEKIEPYFNGGLLLELKGGDKIEVSRRQTLRFKEMMSL